ncbi:MAG: antibiotic biosynthesis monooxygenase family protein [Alphaproteobacteria bacterium]|nr:antibiotic biosynthesis monooxygenase family protein [Alphaproteobacteria bacterium]
MATILAHIKIFDGKAEEFEKIIQPLYEASHRLEPGLRRYEYWRATEPNTYYCLLAFDDFVRFMEHQTSDHHEAPDFPALLEDIQLEWLDPVQGASDLPPTEPKDIPADAGDLMKEYAKNYPVDVQGWWKKLRG